jgi:hypothetical protein
MCSRIEDIWILRDNEWEKSCKLFQSKEDVDGQRRI